MMSFVLQKMYESLEILDEINSQVTFKCPSCKGKIRASKTQPGKYLCVSDGCSNQEIRAYLGVPYKFSRGIAYPEMSKLSYSSQDSIIGVRNKDDCYKNVEIEQDNEGNPVRSIYYLSDKSYIIRNKSPDSYKPFEPHINEKFPPFFNENLLENKFGVVVFHEGEKCAHLFTAFTGMVGMSIPTNFTANNEEYMNYRFQQIKDKVSAILYFPDNDETGRQKAKDFVQIANHNLIKVKELAPYKPKKQFEEGDDVEELIQKGVDLKHFIIKKL